MGRSETYLESVLQLALWTVIKGNMLLVVAVEVIVVHVVVVAAALISVLTSAAATVALSFNKQIPSSFRVYLVFRKHKMNTFQTEHLKPFIKQMFEITKLMHFNPWRLQKYLIIFIDVFQVL